jgi:uncharacterized protein YacL (UPF0231 family)
MDNSDLIAGVVQRVGQNLNAQLNISWNTKQTLEQYLEVLKDNQNEFTFDGFIEYVMLNSVEEIMNSIQSEGPSLLEENLSITDSEGTPIY